MDSVVNMYRGEYGHKQRTGWAHSASDRNQVKEPKNKGKLKPRRLAAKRSKDMHIESTTWAKRAKRIQKRRSKENQSSQMGIER